MRVVTVVTALLVALVPWLALDAVPAAGTERSHGEITSRSLGDRLAALQRAHGFVVFLHPAVRTADWVTGDVDGLSPEAALARLLGKYEFFLQYGIDGQDDAATNRLKAVWIFPRDEGDKLLVVSEEALEVISAPASTDTAAAVRDAIARSPEDARAVVADALGETDENVRYGALETALYEGVPISRELLDTFAHDPSELIRLAAFEALVLRAESEPIDLPSVIELALRDPSPLVQSRALAQKEALGPPARTPQPESEVTDTP